MNPPNIIKKKTSSSIKYNTALQLLNVCNVPASALRIKVLELLLTIALIIVSWVRDAYSCFIDKGEVEIQTGHGIEIDFCQLCRKKKLLDWEMLFCEMCKSKVAMLVTWRNFNM